MPRISLHTTVPASVYKKVKGYGKGSLSEGITNLVKIVESKTVTVRIITDVKV